MSHITPRSISKPQAVGWFVSAHLVLAYVCNYGGINCLVASFGLHRSRVHIALLMKAECTLGPNPSTRCKADDGVDASMPPALQSRRLEVRLRTPKLAGVEPRKDYVHMLNATLTATERTLCCVLENYQTPEGFRYGVMHAP